MQWLGIVFEIIREAALLPLFFMLSQAAQGSEQRLVNNTLTGLAVVFMLNLLAAALVWIFAGTLSASVGLNTDLALAAAAYVRLESVGIVLTVVVDFLLVYLAVIDDYRRIIALSLLKTVLLLAADVLLVSPASFSLKLASTASPIPTSPFMHCWWHGFCTIPTFAVLLPGTDCIGIGCG
jgi:Na+-driven multidrug efflux pump